MLHLAVKGRDAVYEGFINDEVLTIAVDLMADLWWQCNEGGWGGRHGHVIGRECIDIMD